MADINQRPLFRKNPYWEKPEPQANQSWGYGPPQQSNQFANPYVNDANRQDITQTYGADQSRPSTAIATPVLDTDEFKNDWGMRPNSMPPLTVGQDSRGNSVMTDEGDSQISYGDNDLVKQGIGSVLSAGSDIMDTIKDNVRVTNPDGDTVFGEFEGDNYETPKSDALDNELDEVKNFTDSGIGAIETEPGTESELIPPMVNTDTNEVVNEDLLNILAANKKPDETFEEFAKRIGVNLSDKPYDNWDYIRDMSAGLLASKEDSFLGALGDASLLSNAARSKAEDRDDTKRTSVALTKFKYDEDTKTAAQKADAIVEAARLKAEADGNKDKLASKSHTSTVNGLKVTKTEVISGFEDSPFVTTLPDNTRIYTVTENDVDALESKVWERGDDLIKRVDKGVQSERMDKLIQDAATNKTFQGVYLSKAIESGKLTEFQNVMHANNIEGAAKLSEWTAHPDEGDNAEKGAQLASMLEAGGRIGRDLYTNFQAGLYNDLNNSQQEKMKWHIADRARDMANAAHRMNPDENYSADEFITPAMDWVMDHMKWDDPDNLFTFDSTSAQLEAMQLAHGDKLGKDFGNFVFSSDMEAAEISKYDARHDDTFYQTPAHEAGENALWNMDQFELAKPEHQKLYISDSAGLVNKLE